MVFLYACIFGYMCNIHDDYLDVKEKLSRAKEKSCASLEFVVLGLRFGFRV
jgi:hypothetical protein